MKTICFFNNKGGVGKTTTCANLAAHLARDHRVLVLDLDPQSNITNYILGREESEELILPYYDDVVEKNYDTIIDAFEEIDETHGIKKALTPISGNRFNVSIIPGNPLLSNYEDLLSKRWNDINDPDDSVLGLKVTNWVTGILNYQEENFDYAIIDLGPSLGAINRCALLAADYFVTPMTCDIYSLVALKNISAWLDKWSSYYLENLQRIAQEKKGRWASISSGLAQDINILKGYIGYTIQSYIAKKKADGKRRTTASFQRIIDGFAPEISKHLLKYAPGEKITPAKLKLGEVSHMYGILPLSQYVNAPIMDLDSNDGMIGSHYTQATKYISEYDAILKRILKNIGDAQ